MVDFLLDPAALGVPRGEDEAEPYLRRLLALQSLARTDGVRMLSLHDAQDVLVQAQVYPLWDNIPEGEWFHRRSVAELANTLLLGTFYDDLLDVEVLVDNATCTPDQHLVGRPDVLIDAHHRLLCLTALGAEIADVQSAPVFTAGLPQPATGCPVDFEGQALVDSRSSVVDPEPRPYAGNGILVESLDAAIEQINPEAEWPLKDMQRLALNVCIAKVQPIFSWPQTRPWSFGKSFVKRATELGFLTEPAKIKRLLEVCADVVLEGGRGEPHPIRTSKSGNAPDLVRVRDQAAAMRRDMSRDGHLHYWATTRGPEFSYITTEHDDYTILAD